VVVAIRKINDADTFKTGVIDKASAVIAAAGGRFAVRTDKITSLDGALPKRIEGFVAKNRHFRIEPVTHKFRYGIGDLLVSTHRILAAERASS
jgi:hypothetical protein